MLVLTRNSNESIMIGDEIEISILSVRGDKVRVGVTAPRDVPVFRDELCVQKREWSQPSGRSGA